MEETPLNDYTEFTGNEEVDVLSVQSEEVPSTFGEVAEYEETIDDDEVDEMYTNIPFELKYVFGNNPVILSKNITIDNENIVLVHGAGHIVTIYNHKTKVEENLMGHDCTLFNYAFDKTTRFLASCDTNTTIIIWDTFYKPKPIPIFSIYESHPNQEMGAMDLSYDAKYLVTVNSKPQITIKFWLWTYGLDKADDEQQIPIRYGAVKSINFSCNENENEYLVITLANGVVFGTWYPETSKLELHYPKNVKVKGLNHSIYIENTRKVISISNNGKVIIWSDIIVGPSKIPTTNKKEFIKCLQLRPCGINTIDNADGVIVIGDDSGDVRFYDNELKLLYWYEGKTIGPIATINFHRVPRKYKIEDAATYSPRDNESSEILYKQLLPLDATIEKHPFIIRNFIIGTKTGKVGLVNPMNHTYSDILFESENVITTFCLHPYKTVFCAANKSSRVFQIDYKKKKLIRQYTLPQSGEVNEISCITFSKSGNYLLSGMENGELWFLDPFLLTPTQSFIRLTTERIMKIRFIDEFNFAYSDMNSTVVLVHLNECWHFVGKYRYHTKPIVALLQFHIENDDEGDDEYFLSVSEDRAIVKYSVKKSLENLNLTIVTSVRVDQFAIPKSAILIPFNEIEENQVSTELVILVADDNYKLKLYDLNTFQHLKTINGPKFDNPITNMIFSEEKYNNDSFIVFSTTKLLGILLLPFDGNPFKYLGMIGHSIKINYLHITSNFKSIFILGESSYTVIQWKMNKNLIKKNYLEGGDGLLPFVSLLPGGRDGWLFKEMQDMFYYIQIMCEGIDSPMERIVKNFILISEVADYMRGIGYFPSDYEINNMTNELIRRQSKKNIKVTEVSFENLVKLYINYRPATQIKVKEIENAVEFLSYLYPSDVDLNTLGINSNNVIISRDKIMSIMTVLGEPLSEMQAAIYLRELLSKTDDTEKEVPKSEPIEKILKYIPESYSMEEFMLNIMGIEFNEETPLYNENVDPSKINNQLNNEIKFNLPVQERVFDDFDDNEDIEEEIEPEYDENEIEGEYNIGEEDEMFTSDFTND